MIENKDKYLNELKEDDDQGRIHLVTNLLYMYVSNRPRVNMNDSEENIKKTEDMLVHYEFDLMDKVQF